MWETFGREIAYSVRVLLRRPGFSAAIVFTLALGIASTTTIFSAIHAVLIRPLPYHDPDRIVTLWNRYGKIDQQKSYVSVPDYFDRKNQSRTLESVATYAVSGFDLTGQGEPVRVQGARVTASFFPLLGVAPLRGRFLLPEEDQPEKNNVVVISHGFWTRHMAQDPQIIGRTIQLNGIANTVVGVMPASFRYPLPDVELWTPIAFQPEQTSDEERGNEFLLMIGRIKEGVSLSETRAEMEWIAAQVPINVPERREFLLNSGWGATVIPLRELLAGEIKPALIALLGAVLFLLLVVCANVIHLLLVHHAGRQKDIAVRAALGATRWQMVRAHLTESVLLTCAGGAGGLILAVWSLRALKRITPVDVSLFGEIRVDAAAFVFVLALSLALGCLLGLLSGVRAPSLNESTLRISGRSGRRDLLVAAEVALSLILFISATLMMKSFLRLMNQDPGFQSSERLTMSLSLPRVRYPELPQRAEFYKQLTERISVLPNVQAIGAAGRLPLAGENWTATFRVEGYIPPAGGVNPGFEYNVITPDYLNAMGIKLHLGRDFSHRDTAQSPLVVLVDEKLAKRFWPGEHPIGKKIAYDGDSEEWREVIGVTSAVRNTGLQSIGQEQVYFPHSQMPLRTMFLAVRGTNPLPAIRAAVSSLDPQLPLDRIRTMEAIVSESVARPRFSTWLLGLFAGISLLLATVGIYGVVSYTVRQQTREIGIRMALGATQGSVAAHVLRKGMTATLAGICSGICGAIAISTSLRSFLYQVQPTDPATLAAAAVIMLFVASLACFLPARRAAQVNPLEALRQD